MAAQPSYSQITSQESLSRDITTTTKLNAITAVCEESSFTGPAPPELCPPHWRLRSSTRSLRIARTKEIALKALLKQYAITTKPKRTPPPTPAMATPVRAHTRTKDSDDYLTARAANPRTGLISPSLAGTPSPRTPDSPAEALKLRHRRNLSSTHDTNLPEIKLRPALTRSNEAQISAGTLRKLRAGGNGWSFEDARFGIASPRASDAIAGAADMPSTTARPRFPATEPSEEPCRDDQFVVNMPSAREPQPYAYPGRSAEEIQAFEHYKSKARKTSGEGYDQRRLHSGGIRKTSAEIGGRHTAARRVSSGENERHCKKANGGGVAPGYFTTTTRRDGTVVRRGSRSNLEILDGIAFPGGEMLSTAASFAPYSSPKTPARKTGNRQAPITHLSQLPKLHLVHPELASLPLPKLRQKRSHVQASTRSCSLCRDASPDTDTCSRLTNDSHHPHHHSHPLFVRDDDDENSLQFAVDHAQALMSYLVNALRAVHGRLGDFISIRIPKPALLATLTSTNASVEEKILASRALLSLVGQIVGVLVAVSVLWKVLDAVAGLVWLLVWPLAVPMRLVWWVFVG